MSSDIIIRESTLTDLAGITEIYNEVVRNSTATFDTVERSQHEQVAWLAQHGGKYPVIVAVRRDSVLGWASLSPWSSRCAYDGTAELSIYVHRDFRGAGIGNRLMGAVIDLGRERGLHTILARISEGGSQSQRLHEKFGFRHVGVMQEVGRKFRVRLDVTLLQLIL